MQQISTTNNLFIKYLPNYLSSYSRKYSRDVEFTTEIILNIEGGNKEVREYFVLLGVSDLLQSASDEIIRLREENEKLSNIKKILEIANRESTKP